MTKAGLVEESRKLRAAVRAQCDKSALLVLKLAATIARSRFIVAEAHDRLESVKSWNAYRRSRAAGIF
jgi:hypothetical protein